MRKEHWPGETQLKDNIDDALRSYFDGFKAAAKADPDNPIFELWEDQGDIPVGWIVVIQTLGHDDENQSDVDGFVDISSTGMSRFTAAGLLSEAIDSGSFGE